jgi:hypothetical protein
MAARYNLHSLMLEPLENQRRARIRTGGTLLSLAGLNGRIQVLAADGALRLLGRDIDDLEAYIEDEELGSG